MSLSPRITSKKLVLKAKPFKVLVLGQNGVGKTALTVRFVTKRFIFDYDPTLERKYSTKTDCDDEFVHFEVFDTAGQDPQNEILRLGEHIKWADAFLLVFSITDYCSFDECTRLRFLINHAKRHRHHSSGGSTSPKEAPTVFLIGTKADLEHERLVSYTTAKKKQDELRCAGYYEISAKESYEDASKVFHDLYRHCTSQSFTFQLNEESCYFKKQESPRQLSRENSLVEEVSVYSRQRRHSVLMGGGSKSLDIDNLCVNTNRDLKDLRQSIKRKVQRKLSERRF